MRSNPGLKSRFDRTFVFEDFTAEELYAIALLMLEKEGLQPEREAAGHLKNYLEILHRGKNQFFGNARSVRKIVERSVRNQHLRMADTPSRERTRAMISVLKLEDVAEFKLEETAGAGRIGFRF
jgi:hypothetical protein